MKLAKRQPRSTGWKTWAAFGGAGLLAIVAMTATTIDAHKGITSKYTYNDDVFPILRDKCGSCHVPGGAAPMSLLTYKDEGGAVAWAESIRENLVAGSMPPYYADPTGPAVKNPHALSPRELDIVVTWAAGGTPQGDLHKMPPDMKAHVQWGLGKPDLEIPVDAYTLAAGAMAATGEFTLATNLKEAKWIKAADLLPGNSSIVRRATIRVDNGPVLAEWEPGDDATAAPGGTGFKLEPGAKLRVQIAYKKPYLQEQDAVKDQSVIGLYFTDEPLSGKSIEAFAVDGGDEGSATRTFSASLPHGGRVLAVRPQLDQAYDSMTVTAIAASGRKVPLIKFRAARPEWPRRYWLADPVELPAGTKIEVVATPGDPDSGPLGPAVKNPLQISLDLVSQ